MTTENTFYKQKLAMIKINNINGKGINFYLDYKFKFKTTPLKVLSISPNFCSSVVVVFFFFFEAGSLT